MATLFHIHVLPTNRTKPGALRLAKGLDGDRRQRVLPYGFGQIQDMMLVNGETARLVRDLDGNATGDVNGWEIFLLNVQHQGQVEWRKTAATRYLNLGTQFAGGQDTAVGPG